MLLLAHYFFRRFFFSIEFCINFIRWRNILLSLRRWSVAAIASTSSDRTTSSSTSTLILSTLGVDICLCKMLSTKRTDKLILFKFSCIPVNETSPLIHFVSCLLVELVLKVVVLLLKFLRKFKDGVISKPKLFSLFFIMFHQDPFFCKLSWQVIGVDIDLCLELFGPCVLNVIVDVSVPVKES